ncbi:MAG: ethanolamine ammonia-lyase light chain EutC, partial [Acidaminococcales bacterium]|nr:ethanolamine ammonia-lyase light chain EutC [Acidaminococcales bacterium]
TKPYLGRKFSAETIALIRDRCRYAPTVQLYVCDGLSGAAIEANAEDVLQGALQGLKAGGIDYGTPFFVRYGRVRAMDEITAALDAKVTIVLIGERPGLATAESMSAYISYMGYPGMPENNNIVIANIHQAGTPPVEAGAYIAHVADRMLRQKVLSVHDLKL